RQHLRALPGRGRGHRGGDLQLAVHGDHRDEPRAHGGGDPARQRARDPRALQRGTAV
ncbi:MAG: D-aminopeptidase, partial [uncultured Gemmatimonadaceae bacterium]